VQGSPVPRNPCAKLVVEALDEPSRRPGAQDATVGASARPNREPPAHHRLVTPVPELVVHTDEGRRHARASGDRKPMSEFKHRRDARRFSRPLQPAPYACAKVVVTASTNQVGDDPVPVVTAGAPKRVPPSASQPV